MAQSDDGGRNRSTGRAGRSPDEGHHDSERNRHDDENGASPEGPRRRRIGAVEVARRAVEQLTELTGRSPDTVTSIERLDDGWHLTVELVELERIPASTNLLGSYDAELDEEGNLMSYERVRRYHRGQADEF